MTVGTNIKRLRVNKGITQEQLGNAIGVSSQAVSKWENNTTLPDIGILPVLADYFGISIDELMGYRVNALTYKEQFVKFMMGNGIIRLGDFELRHGQRKNYYLDTEKFTTNAQIAKIGEYFADFIREHDLEFDVVVGLAYHGIAFSVATVCSLYSKYGITVDYCFDRKVPDSRGRSICGHTLRDGEKIILIDDMMSTGGSICKRIEELKKIADIHIEAVIVIADLTDDEARAQGMGAEMLEKTYGVKVYSIIEEKDVRKFIVT